MRSRDLAVVVLTTIGLKLASTAAATPMPPSPVVSASLTAIEISDLVAAHDSIRAEVGVGLAPLVWNVALARGAEAWAQTCRYRHSDSAGAYGENLYVYSRSTLTPTNPGDPVAAVNAWASEKAAYTGAGAPFDLARDAIAGHYTAIVGTVVTEVGCGRQICPPGTIYPRPTSYIVCRYRGMANVSGLGTGLYPRSGCATPTPAPVFAYPSAKLVRWDTSTLGSWIGKYGLDGYLLANGATQLPSYAKVALTGQTPTTWVAATADPRGLQNANGKGRFAATWYADTSFTIEMDLTDGREHQVAVHFMNWDAPRSQKVEVLDARTGEPLLVSTTNEPLSPSPGIYWVLNLTGHVLVRVTRMSGPNAVVSGVFFR